MLNFLGSFSDSFLLAVFFWPFVALFLTLPVLLIQYIRFHRLPKARVAVIYLFMLYALALAAFTLYPIPDNPAKFCADYNLSPQLNPIQFIADIREDGLRAVLQIVMNVAFFVPLGVFLKNLFGRKIIGTIIIALLVSLFIETAQLTGAFGIFPCSYRLFDVDDLALNVIGAVLGFLLAFTLPNFSRPKKREEINARPGLVHRFVAFLPDLMTGELLAILILLPFYFLTGREGAWQDWQFPTRIIFFVLLQFVVPLTCRGRTIFARLTGITIDDHARGALDRFLLYAARLVLVGAFVFFNGLVPLVIAIVTLLYYLIFRKMPYTLVDIFFSKAKKKKSTTN
jgi:glycopeptide antibiotics resistance protein